jgi:hypothetical protein
MPASMRSRGMLARRMLWVLLLATACNAGGSAADGQAEVSFALTSPESKEPIEEVRFTVVVTEG